MIEYDALLEEEGVREIKTIETSTSPVHLPRLFSAQEEADVNVL